MSPSNMKTASPQKKLLVISRNPNLAEIARKAAGEAVTVDYASGEAGGLDKIRGGRPDIIIIGDLDTPQSVQKLYGDLREGWISHHASLLIVESDPSGSAFRILGDENLTMGDRGFHLFGRNCRNVPRRRKPASRIIEDHRPKTA